MNARYGLKASRILLPEKGTDWTRWSVVACDQYSAQADYWEKVDGLVGSAPSTLRLMLPEAWLGDEAREKAIVPAMRRYLSEGILRQTEPCMVWLRRETTAGPRRGLVASLDLEAYDYAPDSRSLVRATEATVAARLPARVRVRREAALEMPHVMVLIDDPAHELAGLLSDAEAGEPMYDFPLMMEGGRVTGWKVDAEKEKGIEALLEKWSAQQGTDPMLFAVGDGNHSLAAAKVFWEEVKASLPVEEREDYPARFALVEIVNLHDPALVFEPIHRLFMDVDGDQLLDAVRKELDARGLLGTGPADSHVLPWISGGKEEALFMKRDAAPLPLVPLQPILDGLVPASSQEYIHGEAALRDLAGRPGNAGLLLPALDKTSLFSEVRRKGPLPRKCFSMGEAQDKRFYLECRVLNWDKEVLPWES